MTFPVNSCPKCGGRRIWIDQSFNPYPVWRYAHKAGCIAGKFYSDRQQDQEAKEFGVCAAHGFKPAADCPTCGEIADADYWGDDGL